MRSMETVRIKCPSVTYAMKARNLLISSGYRLNMKKVSDAEKGCGYVLNIITDRSEQYIIELLRRNGIKAGAL